MTTKRPSRALNTTKRHRSTARATLETLETRRLMTSVVVNEATDIVYAAGSGLISLRNAIALANASTTPTTITFAPSVFSTPKTILLDNVNNGALTFNSRNEITVDAPATGLTIRTQNSSFPYNFAVIGDLTPVTLENFTFDFYGLQNNGALTLDNVKISGGQLSSDGGSVTMSGCTVSGSTSSNPLDFDSAANLKNVTISGNTTLTHPTMNVGPLGNIQMTDVTLWGNTGTTHGAIYNDGKISLTNVTIANNTAGSSTSPGSGAAIYNQPNATVSLFDVTISGNKQLGGAGTGAGGGGILNNAVASDFTIANSIVAGNTAANLGPDVYGGFTSKGHNLIGKTDASSGWISSDYTGTIAKPLNAELGSLANNGGSTETLRSAVEMMRARVSSPRA